MTDERIAGELKSNDIGWISELSRATDGRKRRRTRREPMCDDPDTRSRTPGRLSAALIPTAYTESL